MRLLAASLAALAACTAARAEPPQAQDPYYLRSKAQLEANLAAPVRPDRARNVILFVGDGMGVSTVVAARIQAGQQAGGRGDDASLSFERLPNLALSKTYAHDAAVTDSAASITGLMSGVKAANGVIGLDGRARFEDCASAMGARVDSLAEMAKARGLAVGVVTNTRLTDATPAGVYGHTPSRDWEDDSVLPPGAAAEGCTDLARQLAEAMTAGRVDVAMGGGRSRLLPEAKGGRRADGRDLVGEWLAGRKGRRYVTTRTELLKSRGNAGLLGLFSPEHMPYLLSQPVLGGDLPSLAEMTTAALDVLEKRPDGYFLLVEGGLIDKASHLNNAARTLAETQALDAAVQAALGRVDLSDTLVIVTADHSHGLVISGGAERGAPILGLAAVGGQPLRAGDGKPYPILSYATGPGAENGARADLGAADTRDPDFLQPALAPMESAEHSGEDVAIYADGPGARAVRGVVEQPYVFQVMRRALGL
jgi:alkaline phosphatase